MKKIFVMAFGGVIGFILFLFLQNKALYSELGVGGEDALAILSQYDSFKKFLFIFLGILFLIFIIFLFGWITERWRK